MDGRDSPNVDIQNRFIKRGVDVVDRDRVVWVRGVAADVDDNAETTGGTCGSNGGGGDERGDGGG